MYWLLLVHLACAATPKLHTETAELRRNAASPLPVKAIWPDGDGPFPVIVFSHGVYGSRDGYKPLVEHWARAGYLVLLPSHNDRGEPSVSKLVERPLEITHVLDRVPALIEKAGLKGKVDLERIGVGGHSFGGHTAMMSAGLVMTNPKNGNKVVAADKRVDALLVISPAGIDESIRPDAWKNLVHPAMYVIGSEDVSKRTGKGAHWRMQAWSGLRSGWLLWMEGADHDYGGIAGKGDGNRQHVKILKEATLKYWDASLKKNADAEGWLDSDALKEKTAGNAEIKRRKAVD